MAEVRRLGHADVATTMVYTHVMNRGACVVRSPADRLWARSHGSVRPDVRQGRFSLFPGIASFMSRLPGASVEARRWPVRPAGDAGKSICDSHAAVPLRLVRVPSRGPEPVRP